MKINTSSRLLMGFEAVAVSQLRKDFVVQVDGQPSEISAARATCYSRPAAVTATWTPRSYKWTKAFLEGMRSGVWRGYRAVPESQLLEPGERAACESQEEFTAAWRLAKIERALWDREDRALRAAHWRRTRFGGWIRIDPTTKKVIALTQATRAEALAKIDFHHDAAP